MKQAEESSGNNKREPRITARTSYSQEQKIVESRPFSERCAYCHMLVASVTSNYLRGAMIRHLQKCKEARGINPEEDERDDEECEAMQDVDVMEGREREAMDGSFEGGEGGAIEEEENWVDLDGEEEFIGEDAIVITGHQKEVGDEDSDDGSKYGSGDESEIAGRLDEPLNENMDVCQVGSEVGGGGGGAVEHPEGQCVPEEEFTFVGDSFEEVESSSLLVEDKEWEPLIREGPLPGRPAKYYSKQFQDSRWAAWEAMYVIVSEESRMSVIMGGCRNGKEEVNGVYHLDVATRGSCLLNSKGLFIADVYKKENEGQASVVIKLSPTKREWEVLNGNEDLLMIGTCAADSFLLGKVVKWSEPTVNVAFSRDGVPIAVQVIDGKKLKCKRV